jgi:hypothetical protein
MQCEFLFSSALLFHSKRGGIFKVIKFFVFFNSKSTKRKIIRKVYFIKKMVKIATILTNKKGL